MINHEDVVHFECFVFAGDIGWNVEDKSWNGLTEGAREEKINK